MTTSEQHGPHLEQIGALHVFTAQVRAIACNVASIAHGIGIDPTVRSAVAHRTTRFTTWEELGARAAPRWPGKIECHHTRRVRVTCEKIYLVLE